MVEHLLIACHHETVYEDHEVPLVCFWQAKVDATYKVARL